MAPQRFGSNIELLGGIVLFGIAAAVASSAVQNDWGWWAWGIVIVLGAVGLFNIWQGFK